MRPLTRAQRVALLAIYRRPRPARRGGYGDEPAPRSYLQFRRTARREICGDAVMVPWCGMWLGIESDGYTHS